MENINGAWIFGIALSGEEIDDCYLESISKEYDMPKKDVKKLKMAHLFRLSDNVRFRVFDADIVLFDKAGAYYHTGDFEPIQGVVNDKIIAVVDENSEIEII